jgi:hypothetical protein
LLKTNERLNLILAVNKSGLDLRLIKESEPEALLKLCGRLKENQAPPEWYGEQLSIQKELLKHERFFFYLQRAVENENLMPYAINDYVAMLHKHGKNTGDYPENRLSASMEAAFKHERTDEAFYDYLTCFSSQALDENQTKVVLANIDHYGNVLAKPIAELPDSERALLFEEALANHDLMPSAREANRIFDLLTRNEELLYILRFLHNNNLNVGLKAGNLEAFCINPKGVLEKLTGLLQLLGENKMFELLERWMENNCPYYDLEVFSKHFGKEIGELSEDDFSALDDILDTRSGYINFIYGGRFKAIPLSEVSRYKEDILIYAITNKKSGFIRLVEENYDAFSNLRHDSVLFTREFYSNHVNINALNVKNLQDCGWMAASKLRFDELGADKSYTFEEIKALYDLPIHYYRLYTGLEIASVDKRLIAFRQISKRRLLSVVTEDEQIAKLAALLSQKTLSAWRDDDFAHIAGLKAHDAVKLLIHMENVGKLIPQMKTRTDVLLVTRNPDKSGEYDTLDEMKSKLAVTDTAWGKLVAKMNLSDEFLKQNKERVVEFLCKNGADLAHTYYNGLEDDHQRESLKRIVKAVLLGEFSKLKYYADDLRMELDYPVAQTQKLTWMENTEFIGSDFEVKECDDFYATIQMGEMPQHTCLSYINGGYKECLLSSFDSNKKILYAYKDGEIVGRAILRLTKGRFNLPEESGKMPAFSFVDVETISDEANGDISNQKETKDNSESLILFLERPYAAGISGQAEQQVENMYVDLLIKKALSMGALPVVSHAYDCVANRKDFVQAFFHVYISKSKAGAQYLDSLNGSAKVSDEGGYRSNSFYIHKDSLEN